MTKPLKFMSDEEKTLWVQAYAAAQANGALHRADRIADNAIVAYRERLPDLRHDVYDGEWPTHCVDYHQHEPEPDSTSPTGQRCRHCHAWKGER